MGEPRAHPSLSQSAGPSANHLPRRPSPSRPSAGPARPAPASSARLQPRADDAPSWTWRATTPTPAIPSRTAAGPPATPRNLTPVGHRDAQTPDAGHWTPGRSDARTGHRSLGQTRVGHRTLAPDTGHRMPDTNADTVNDSTAGIRTSLAATPSDRTLGRATVFVLSHYQPAARPLRRPSGASAHCCPWMISGRG